jgi:hypothetical protein
VVVVLPASIWAAMPMFLALSMGTNRGIVRYSLLVISYWLLVVTGYLLLFAVHN